MPKVSTRDQSSCYYFIEAETTPCLYGAFQATELTERKVGYWLVNFTDY